MLGAAMDLHGHCNNARGLLRCVLKVYSCFNFLPVVLKFEFLGDLKVLSFSLVSDQSQLGVVEVLMEIPPPLFLVVAVQTLSYQIPSRENPPHVWICLLEKRG